MRRKMLCSNRFSLCLLVCLISSCYSRPQDVDSLKVPQDLSVDVDRDLALNRNNVSTSPIPASTPSPTNELRNVKSKTPVIGDSIKMVTSQLLQEVNGTAEPPIISDTRIPPKLKSQIPLKNKIKTRSENDESKLEHSHAGVAVPVSIEELESEKNNLNLLKESSTSHEGISTWILLTNPTHKDELTTEPMKIEETTKKPKPTPGKNKTKRPGVVNKMSSKNPIIASINKSDLIAGGSAINENVLSKIKDTVLNNVQKNKVSSTVKTTTEPSTTAIKEVTAKKETKATSTEANVTNIVTLKPKKKNKLKPKPNTISTAIREESAILPMEPKEQEIELEVSTPATISKKTKKTSSKRKKNKTKKRKTSSEKNTSVSTELKSSNKTKTVKPAKDPGSPITTQIYNYLSREVMPSVGVGVIGLAGLVGLASYFLYPFATPVRRTFEVDKKDDLYRFNAEEYANEGNGQAEEEMLGTVLAGMPAHSKNRLNPFANQSPHASGPVKKEQDSRYRYVASSHESQHYNNVHFPQQKTGIAHGAAYPDSVSYSYQNQELRHAYSPDTKYAYETVAYTPYPSSEPIFAASQTDKSEAQTYGNNDESNAVVYGIKPTLDSEFKPVYPFEGQVFSETTINPSTSLYLGSNNEPDDTKYAEDKIDSGGKDNMFVVGNVPKELVDTVTPAVVPEHGPRKIRKRRQVVSSENGIYLSNEVDGPADFDVLPISTNAPIQETTGDIATQAHNDQFVESIFTVPIDTENRDKTTTERETDFEAEVELQKVNEVIESSSQNTPSTIDIKYNKPETDSQSTTQLPTIQSSTLIPGEESSSKPEVITYPPINTEDGFFSFLKRIIEFKFRLGMSILQTTSESLNRYLKSMDHTVHARASHT